MPVYEFRCNDTGKRFEVKMSYADYDPDAVRSPFTGSDNVSRIIGRVRVVRSEMSRFEQAFDGDESAMDALDDLEDADPRTLGRALRHFGKGMEDDLGGEFNEVVGRLESGESPESIEASMPEDGSIGDG
jgi:putative FmdB family regulatory protein